MIVYDVLVLSITSLTRCWIAPILSSPFSTAAEIEKGVLQDNSPAADGLDPYRTGSSTECPGDSYDSGRLMLVLLQAAECPSHSDSLQ